MQGPRCWNVSGNRCRTTHTVIILVRLAIGTRGWCDELATTHRLGIATAALPWLGQAISVFLGIVVVVVAGTVVVVVVVDVGFVVVATGSVVVVVVVAGTVVVVVGNVVSAHTLGRVVVVDARAGLSWADVVVDVETMNKALSAKVRSGPRRSQWLERRVTQ